MGRYSSNPSYDHRVKRLGSDWYRISWVSDRYYPSSRLRHPRLFTRDTDLAGARRFARRWDLQAYQCPHPEVLEVGGAP